MTREQAFKRINAIKELKNRAGFDPLKIHLYRWTIGANPANLNELKIQSYSSLVSAFGFETKQEANDFMEDEENMKLLKEAYL